MTRAKAQADSKTLGVVNDAIAEAPEAACDKVIADNNVAMKQSSPSASNSTKCVPDVRC